MGQFAFPVRTSSVEAGAPKDQPSGPSARVEGKAGADTVAADSEARRVLTVLRLTLDRLPE